MKKIIIVGVILFTLFVSFTATAQLQQASILTLTYDASGNRVQRHLTIVELTSIGQPSKKINPSDTLSKNNQFLNEEDSIKEEDITQGVYRRILVYPNPAQTSVKIEITNQLTTDYVAVLFDVNGRELTRKTFNGNTCEIDLSALQTADYFLNVISNGKQTTWKVIKN